MTTGLADAVVAARDRVAETASEAGPARDVVIMGGGATVGSAVAAGLVDSLTLHIAPVLLGSGTPLFADPVPRELSQRSAVVTANAVHVTYDLV